jgi:hypothetical protein
MGIVDHIISTGAQPNHAMSIVGGVTTLALTSTNTSQATAMVIGGGGGYISVVSASGRAAQLPLCSPGSTVFIYNGGANTATIYGQTGELIGAGSANSGVPLATKKAMLVKKMTATIWGEILSA